MSTANPDPHIAAHLEWLGFVRPTGLVVSAPALVRAGAILDRRDAEGQRLLRECTEERSFRSGDEPRPWLPDFRAFAGSVLGWSFSPRGYAGTDEAPIPPELEAALGDSGEVLRPDFAVRAEPLQNVPAAGAGFEVRESAPAYQPSPTPSSDTPSPWQLLVSVCEPAEDFDRVARRGGLEASPHGRMERLLRHTGAPAGLLFNGVSLRLISAPRGESSGWLDFRVSEMVQAAGRPISTAMRLLLGQTRLLTQPGPRRLAALLENSRKFQNEVSERLAEQVLHALYELLRGFQAAHGASKGALLDEPLARDPDEVYRGLLTLVLRLVFLLYAEERDMLPQDETFLGAYSLAGLHQRLWEDAAMHPDTMDQRYGAYAQLLVLFRMVHDGAHSDGMALPPRRGALFDPDRYRFLEGRGQGGARQVHEGIEPPLVPDGAIYRVLEKLMVLDGERISYRALDVEHIGSVYETMMGFRLETASGRSVAVRAAKKQGAPASVDVEALLREAPAKRAKWLQDRTDRKLTDRVKRAVQEADHVEALHAALDPVIDRNATPDLAPPHAMILQPNEERRRSGSHYTPRELTEPIVRHTLEPVLARLRAEAGKAPRPERILDIKVCDPAMGSGAFLVEACRQLAEVLVDSWRAHDAVPEIPPDENEVVFARRLVAQRCLYGVDRNPVAVDLAKLSLWLITLAKDHPLTFLDHALRHGDSLVGLTRTQIEAFHWEGDAPQFQAGFEVMRIRERLREIAALRRRIREAGEEVSDGERRRLWREARGELDQAGVFGDLVLAAFFEEAKPGQRKALRMKLAEAVVRGETDRYRSWLEELRNAEPPLAPFHWEVEFPEVFERENPGFDAMVGNPPFLGGKRISTTLGPQYRDWLASLHAESSSNADLVAHFFRRVFDLIRRDGAFGLIATNTIAQGDTRSSGLRWIGENGGEIYKARRRVKWPGLAAVVVSVIHIGKGQFASMKYLDDEPTENITAFLFHFGGHADPIRLGANTGKSFVGAFLRGMGFTFDDTDKKGVATPLAEMRCLVDEESRNLDVILPYIGGEEVNTHPAHAHHRYAINFHDYPLRRENVGKRWVNATETQRHEWLRTGIVPIDYPGLVADDWPALLTILEQRVKPARSRLGESALDRTHKTRWWQYANDRPQLHASIAKLKLKRVLANSQVSATIQFVFLPSGMVYAHTLNIYPCQTYAAFCALQSRPHEIWARFFGSSMKDDLRYTPSDCFETFPENWETHPDFEAAGKAYYDFRAALMVRNDEGLTKTYNRFHDPNEDDPDIARLRDLHAAMDRAVLDAYGWQDIATDCDFLLDYNIDEEELGNRKKPYRYRWPDETRDEVLARLLERNAARAAEEARAGKAVTRAGENRGRGVGRKEAPSGGAARVVEPLFPWGRTDA